MVTEPMRHHVTEHEFLGALLGMAIGDALGMPVAGWTRERIATTIGLVERYLPLDLPDGVSIKAGEFTDESEAALCIVESLTVNSGHLDPENIGPRMLFLSRGESRRWMNPETIALLTRAEETGFQVPLEDDCPATGDVAARGIPIGLLHAIGRFDPETLRRDAEIVTRLSHGSPRAISATTAIAFLVQLAARRTVPREQWADEAARFIGEGAVAGQLQRAATVRADRVPVVKEIEVLGSSPDAADVVASACLAAMAASTFEEAVIAAVNAGGAADARGALAGALAGAFFGASGIPQAMIDELEGRIYISLAAPWFFRTAQSRAGLLIPLRELR